MPPPAKPTITQNGGISIPTDTIKYCAGNTVTLEYNVSGYDYSYQWYNNTTTIPVDSSSTYRVPSTLGVGAHTYILKLDTAPSSVGISCSSYDTVTVVVAPQPKFNATTSDTVFCYGDSVVLQAKTSFGVDSIVWKYGTTWLGKSATTNVSSYHVLLNGAVYSSGIYSAIAYEGDCRDSVGIEVIIVPLPAKPIISAVGKTINNDTITYCAGDDVTLVYNHTSAFHDHSYRWYNGITEVAPAPASARYTVPNTLIPNSYTYTLVVDTIGLSKVCSRSDTVTVTVKPQPKISVINIDGGRSPVFCERDSVILWTAVDMTVDSIVWKRDGIRVRTDTSVTGAEYRVSPSDNTNYLSGVYSAIAYVGDCRDSVGIRITIVPLPAKPVILANGADKDTVTYCAGGGVNLAYNAHGVLYKWFLNNINSTPLATTSSIVSSS
jgi:hypothetical protein